jgi:hypothetical protein
VRGSVIVNAVFERKGDLPPSPRARAGNTRWGEAREVARPVVLPIPAVSIVEVVRKHRMRVERQRRVERVAAVVVLPATLISIDILF